jgi:hypothetical protein
MYTDVAGTHVGNPGDKKRKFMQPVLMIEADLTYVLSRGLSH